MIDQRRFLSASLALLFVLALGLLAGCERPDPQDAVAEVPTQTATPLPTTSPLPTQAPIQVYVVVVQPTPDDSAPIVQNLPVAAPTQIPATASPPTPPLTVEPTRLPPNYFQGWAWTDSLVEDNGQVQSSTDGLTLRDRPAGEGQVVGVVIGMTGVFIVGQEQCGYTPIMVHAANMVNRTTPHPEIYPPVPLPTEAPPFAPTPFASGNVMDGWAFTDEVTILGETAIAGALGINLRSGPCRAGTNLGFVPAGSNMIVSGPPSGEYTPVRVNHDVLQLPFNFEILAVATEDDVLTSRPENQLRSEASVPTPELVISSTPSPTLNSP